MKRRDFFARWGKRRAPYCKRCFSAARLDELQTREGYLKNKAQNHPGFVKRFAELMGK